jgi:integrase
MSSLKELIKINRPKITDTSISNYLTAIKTLGKKTKINITEPKDIIDNKEVILKYILSLQISNRKKTISALIAVLNDLEEAKPILTEFRAQLYADIKEYESEADNQKLTPTQEEHYIPWKTIQKRYSDLESQVKTLWKKEKLDKREFEMLQDFIILSLYVLTPPRRSKDYTNFKIKNYDDKTIDSKDNFMVIPKNKKKQAEFVFNNYKNESRIGQQVIEIPNTLKKIILKWNEINPNDYLLVNTKGGQLHIQTLKKKLNSIFGGEPVSTNMLRHSFMTQNQTTDLKKLKEIATKMGNVSVESILKYVRKDTDEKS